MMENASPTPTVQVEARGNRWLMAAPEHDHIGSILKTGRPYEHDLLDAVAGLVSAGDVVVDVGANIGNHAVYFAAVCGADVHAYEPNPDTLPYLRKNVSLNGLARRIHVHPEAVSCAAGSGIVRNDRAGELGTGSAHVVPSSDGNVRTVRLDDAAYRRVRLLKIDVEGSEPAVVAGALGMIRRCRPIIVCEEWAGTADGSLRELLAPVGYRRFPLAFAVTPTFVYLPSWLHLARVAASRVVLTRAVARARRLLPA